MMSKPPLYHVANLEHDDYLWFCYLIGNICALIVSIFLFGPSILIAIRLDNSTPMPTFFVEDTHLINDLVGNVQNLLMRVQ